MSKTEDYLDSLLNNVSPERKAEAEQRKRGRISSDFIDEFEKELNDADMEDFIRDFEIEVDENHDKNTSDDKFFDNLEGIVKNAKEVSQQSKETAGEPDFEINTLEDDAWTEQQEEPETAKEETPAEPEASGEEHQRSIEEKELLDMLAELPSDEELSNMGGLIRSERESQKTESVGPEEEASDVSALESEKAEAESGKKSKKGFFGKLLSLLFGEGEEDSLPEAEDSTSSKEAPQESQELSNISEENLQILQELDAAEKAGTDSEPEKEEKGKKKEKKPKEKKEKKPKEKKEKKPKEKKPKEVDLSPPLPKKPVILIFIMGISVVLLIMLASNLSGYSINLSGAKEAFAAQNYVQAYHKMAGLKIKDQDKEFYQRVSILARVQGELDNGNTLYETKKYQMALDSYVCALGRYDANYQDAVTYSVQGELDSLAEQITAQLSDKFGVSAETAREIYGIRSRKEYTKSITEIINTLGLTE